MAPHPAAAFPTTAHRVIVATMAAFTFRDYHNAALEVFTPEAFKRVCVQAQAMAEMGDHQARNWVTQVMQRSLDVIALQDEAARRMGLQGAAAPTIDIQQDRAQLVARATAAGLSSDDPRTIQTALEAIADHGAAGQQRTQLVVTIKKRERTDG